MAYTGPIGKNAESQSQHELILEQNKLTVGAFNRLRAACGYVQNGSDEKVVISQDDATREWVISIGRSNVRTYTGPSLLDAIMNIDDSELETEPTDTVKTSRTIWDPKTGRYWEESLCDVDTANNWITPDGNKGLLYPL